MQTCERIDFRPMLCGTLDVDWFKKNNMQNQQWFVQPKLNGIRAVFVDGGLYTRKGKPILCCSHIISQIKEMNFDPGLILDGELFWKNPVAKKDQDLGKIVSSTRKTVNAVDDPEIAYHIFDCYNPEFPNSTFFHRTICLVGAFAMYGKNLPNLARVETKPLTTEQLRLLVESRSLDHINLFKDHHEGSILRRMDGPYQPNKRSRDVLKVKEFQDAEFEIIGVQELMTHEKVSVPPNIPGGKQYADGSWYKNGVETPGGTLGAFVFKTENGLTFTAGSGLNDEQRDLYWKNPPIGKMATIQFQELSQENKLPLFPVFVVIRDYE